VIAVSNPCTVELQKKDSSDIEINSDIKEMLESGDPLDSDLEVLKTNLDFFKELKSDKEEFKSEPFTVDLKKEVNEFAVDKQAELSNL